MKLPLTHKKIGIWGLGVSGKSMIHFLRNSGRTLSVLERDDSVETVTFCQTHGATLYTDAPQQRDQFFEEQELIIPSPGIDIRPYQAYVHKFFAEVDLFYFLWAGKYEPFQTARAPRYTSLSLSRSASLLDTTPTASLEVGGRGSALGTSGGNQVFNTHYHRALQAPIKSARPECSEQSEECIEGFERTTCSKKKIIAITGTLGKTSITTLLTHLLRHAGIPLATGGNIGTALFDLLGDQRATHALLELSSFQLELCRHFSPDGAIITNLYPNHLDRHGTMEAYLAAKKEILIRQEPGQWALVPLELAQELRKDPLLRERPLNFFTHQLCDPSMREHLLPNDRLYTPDFLDHIPPVSYPQNWLIIAAALDLMGYNAQALIAATEHFTVPQNRLEPVATIHGVTYYNDSKSTIMEATHAAVKMFWDKNVILLLGGTSKGVDRTPALQQLKGSVHHIVCFGKEAKELGQSCAGAAIPHSVTAALESAVHYAHALALQQANSVVVLSPGGASFDLFKDYKARGERFKELVYQLA